MAILKVILDHIEPLKPYGFLIGELERDKEKLPFHKKLKHKLFHWKTK